ncbi:hypothetical protein GJ496_004954 [Pomphorhynchus laevis]|nr:hypothetical protein GJ496_004954 [Pomphorhynchus laevis]
MSSKFVCLLALIFLYFSLNNIQCSTDVELQPTGNIEIERNIEDYQPGEIVKTEKRHRYYGNTGYGYRHGYPKYGYSYPYYGYGWSVNRLDQIFVLNKPHSSDINSLIDKIHLDRMEYKKSRYIQLSFCRDLYKKRSTPYQTYCSTDVELQPTGNQPTGNIEIERNIEDYQPGEIVKTEKRHRYYGNTGYCYGYGYPKYGYSYPYYGYGYPYYQYGYPYYRYGYPYYGYPYYGYRYPYHGCRYPYYRK